MINTILKGLEHQGLQLSPAYQLNTIQELGNISPKKQIINRESQNQQIQALPVKISKINDNMFIVVKGLQIILFKYIISEMYTLSIIKLCSQRLTAQIKEIIVCPQELIAQKYFIPFFVTSLKSSSFYVVNIKDSSIDLICKVNFPNIKCVGFLSDIDIVVLTSNIELVYYQFKQNSKLVEKNRINAQLDLSKDDRLVHCCIVGKASDSQDTIFHIFYSIINDFERLKVKQVLHRFDGKIEIIRQNFQISIIGQIQKFLSNFEVIKLNDYYLLKSKRQILIIKKKYSKYFLMDNAAEKNHNCLLFSLKQQFVCTLNNEKIQLFILKPNDPKSELSLIDQIQVTFKQSSERIRAIWYCIQDKQVNALFIYEKQDGNLCIYCMKKIGFNDKLLYLIKNTQYTINEIQQFAEKLGMHKKKFYLYIWSKSEKQIQHLYKYLLPCADIPSIKKQLNSWLRRKKIQVSQFRKILDIMIEQIIEQLKLELNDILIRQYAKHHFLKRKLKLYSASLEIDHKIFKKLYNDSIFDICIETIEKKLFPVHKELDPLHAMDVNPVIQEILMKHLLQQFKILMLENYQQFLHQLLVKYKSNIVQVIKYYYYLLPNFPFSINVEIVQNEQPKGQELSLDNTANYSYINNFNKQEKWFSDLSFINWKRQITKQGIQAELHQLYSTNDIINCVDKFGNSIYAKQSKLQKHGLICLSYKEQLQKMLEKISGLKLFLKVCQYANQFALQQGVESPIDQLLQIFRVKNGLEGVDYQKCRLYSKMHQFFLKFDIMEGKKITVEELMQIAEDSSNLIAIFFLANRQKKKYILHQFRSLYNSSHEFNSKLKDFIQSENCSRIELHLLIKEIQLHQQKDFQLNNQQLIEIVLQGFILRLQIRQKKQTAIFIKIVQTLHLSLKLAILVDSVQNIMNKGFYVLTHFNLEKKTYREVLRDPLQIFRQILEHFFEENMKTIQQILIEEQKISLSSPINMIQVLMYLQQQVFIGISQKQFLIMYGEVLIEWKEFQSLKFLIYQERMPQQFNFESKQYQTKIVEIGLSKIYSEQTIIFDQQTKVQLKMILDLMQDKTNPIVIRQLAKLNLAQLFQSIGGLIIKPYDIDLIVNEWKQEYKKLFIEDIIGDYGNQLTFEIFKRMYLLLQTTTKETYDVSCATNEFAGFAIYFCEKLRQNQKISEIFDIFAFLKNYPYHIKHSFMAEVFLQYVSIKFKDNRQLAKRYINYFIDNFSNDYVLLKIFESHLSDPLNAYTPNKEICIDQSIIISINKHKLITNLKLQILQQMLKQTENTSIKNQYYCYYFFVMAFKHPKKSLTQLHNFSYDYELILNIFQKIENYVDDNTNLWTINFLEIYKLLKQGLYRAALYSIKNVKKQLKQKQNIQNLEAIKNLLKNNKDNKHLYKAINKIQSHMNVKSLFYKFEMQRRAIRKHQQENQLKKQMTVIENVEQQQEQQPDMNITIKYSELKKHKTNLLVHSTSLTSDKHIIQRVYQDLNQSRFNSPKAKPVTRFKVMSRLFFPASSETYNLQKITQLVLSKNFEKLSTYNEYIVLEALREIYENYEFKFEENLQFISCLKIAENAKIQFANLCKVHQGEISDRDLKRIIPFNFFIDKLQPIQDQNEAIYKSLQKQISTLIVDKRPQDVVSIAQFLQNTLNDKKYKLQLIELALKNVGSEEDTPNNILKIRQYVRQLYQDQQFFFKSLMKIIPFFNKNDKLYVVLKQNVKNLPKIPNIIEGFF